MKNGIKQTFSTIFRGLEIVTIWLRGDFIRCYLNGLAHFEKLEAEELKYFYVT